MLRYCLDSSAAHLHICTNDETLKIKVVVSKNQFQIQSLSQQNDQFNI